MSRIRLAALALGLAALSVPLTAGLAPEALAAGKPEHAGQKGGKPAHAGKPGHAGEGNGNARGNAQGGSARGDKADERLAEAAIAAGTAALIQAFFADELPAGYARPEPLPPGIRKNLARGKPLPPGIARKRLPDSLLGRLPGHPGHDYYAVGRDVVLVEAATRVVVDILRDAI